MVPIELLAPARNFSCGKAAIDHGADAVYIGGPSFGARSAAWNSMADIERLVHYAHRYRARLYLTLNTILFDSELARAQDLVMQAWNAGVDALIIQDTGLLELDLPPLPLIASTQMHNMEADHILFLEHVGFQRVILSRELSLDEIIAIRRQTSIELESFVHGALCVSHSGRCYLSAALGGRSANRGECGQPCRLPWTLIDAEGNVLERSRHLLSLKDMDRSNHLAELMDAGVTSFKIEGRLKDEAYVKNVTAFYRTRIDDVLESRPDFKRSSSGRTEFFFAPDPCRTFCRGTTSFFLDGTDDGAWSPDTPKSIGQEMGVVLQCESSWFSLDAVMENINAGDGLCYFDAAKELQGMQVVRVTGDRFQVHRPIHGLLPGMTVFRNHDHLFLKALEGKTARRRCAVHLTFREIPDGFVLEGRDEDGTAASASLSIPKQLAQKPDAAYTTMRKQLSKLADTMYILSSLDLRTGPYFIRTAELNRLRRDLVAALVEKRVQVYQRPLRKPVPDPNAVYPLGKLDYTGNVSNHRAREFYRRHGVRDIDEAFELQKPDTGTAVMTTRHCLRRCLGACPRTKPHKRLREPLYLEHEGRRFRLEFDCRACRMRVILE